MAQLLAVVLYHEVTKNSGSHYLGWWSGMLKIWIPEDIALLQYGDRIVVGNVLRNPDFIMLNMNNHLSSLSCKFFVLA